MSDDLEKQKAEVLAQIQRAQDKSDRVGEMGRELVRASDETRDAARYESLVVRLLPEEAPEASDFLARTAKRWATLEIRAGDVLNAGASVTNLYTAVVSGSTAIASGSTAIYANIVPWSLQDRVAIEAAESELREKSNLGTILNEIKAEMKRLRLDFERERVRAPSSFVDEAQGAIRVPVVSEGGVTSVLMPLRTAIDQTIDELIRRRPHQEPAPNRRERILSIGRHCSKAGLPGDHFETLAAEDGVINGKLSGIGKRGTTSHAEVIRLVHGGARFLKALLLAVDEARLRAP